MRKVGADFGEDNRRRQMTKLCGIGQFGRVHGIENDRLNLGPPQNIESEAALNAK